MKRFVCIVLLTLLLFTAVGCSTEPELIELTQDLLTEEAKTAFSALEGENGVMLYADPDQMTKRLVRMYAVLYGPSGQELSLVKQGSTLKMNITGEPQDDSYRVYKIEYSPNSVERAEFARNDETVKMDGYEELPFTVEQALLKTPKP